MFLLLIKAFSVVMEGEFRPFLRPNFQLQVVFWSFSIIFSGNKKLSSRSISLLLPKAP